MDKSYQILSPAGSVEQLQMAVQNGCDAVYLGLDKFNARMKAQNFTLDNLSQWVNYCHFFGVKVYVAINISLKNSEFCQAVETLCKVYDAYADGVILTDLALLKVASNLPKPFEIVASTQLNAHDKQGAAFLKNLGADTVVCARECSYDDVKAIDSTGVKVESFIHGALCVCQSGQCLFSSIVGGNSGNRGLCAQPCRKKYTALGKSGYFLSPIDMFGLDVAKDLYQNGARVFKIEGRNRRAEYAGATSRVYSRAFANGFSYSQDDKNVLLEMYNRGGLQNLSYLYGKNDNVIFPQAQNHMGLQVGSVKGKGFVSAVPITKGDGLKVFYNGMEVCGGIATSSGSGYVTAEFSGKVKDGMLVYRTTSVQLCDQVASAKRNLDVSIEFVARVGDRVKVVAKCGEITVEVQSDFVAPKSQNQPLTRDVLCQQLQKTGNSHYTITNIVTQIDDIFLTKAQINGLRREVLEKLTTQIIESYNKQFAGRKTCNALQIAKENVALLTKNCFAQKSLSPNCLAVICKTAKQVTAVDADYVIYKPEFIDKNSLRIDKFYYLDLPAFANLDYLKNVLPNNVGLVCHNVGQVQFVRDNNIKYIAGSGLNIFNDYIASVFCDADTFVYSHELTLAEISAFEHKSGLVFVDGDLTLMKVVHCPYKVVTNCQCDSCKCDGNLAYTDEMGNLFKILRRRDKACSFEILNGKKLSVSKQLVKAGRYLVDFDADVVAHYKNLNNGVLDGYVEKQSYTKGRLFAKIN